MASQRLQMVYWCLCGTEV